MLIPLLAVVAVLGGGVSGGKPETPLTVPPPSSSHRLSPPPAPSQSTLKAPVVVKGWQASTNLFSFTFSPAPGKETPSGTRTLTSEIVSISGTADKAKGTVFSWHSEEAAFAPARGLKLRIQGDGKAYLIEVYFPQKGQSYYYQVRAVAGAEGREIAIPFEKGQAMLLSTPRSPQPSQAPGPLRVIFIPQQSGPVNLSVSPIVLY